MRDACPYCGKVWFPWAGSRLKGHARCQYPPALQDDLLAVLEAFSPMLTVKRLAADVGMSDGTLRALLAAARGRRQHRRAA